MKVWVVLGAGVLAVWSVLAGGTPREGQEVDNIDIESAAPLEPVLAEAKTRQPGRVIGVEFETYRQRVVYEIEILDARGRVWELFFDAKTGAFIERREEHDHK